MDDILPWIGYLAAYIAGGMVGFFGAALFCGSAQSELRTENEALREKLQALESRGSAEDAKTAHRGDPSGLAA